MPALHDEYIMLISISFFVRKPCFVHCALSHVCINEELLDNTNTEIVITYSKALRSLMVDSLNILSILIMISLVNPIYFGHHPSKIPYRPEDIVTIFALPSF
jgi:hypothetical protein